MNFDNYMTPAAAALALGVSKVRILALCQEQRLKFVQTPLGRLITRESVNEYQVNRQPAGRPGKCPQVKRQLKLSSSKI